MPKAMLSCLGAHNALEQRSLRVTQLVQRISPVTLAAGDGLATRLDDQNVFGELAEAMVYGEVVPPAIIIRRVDEAAQLAVEHRRIIRCSMPSNARYSACSALHALSVSVM